jgi:hypothetical protein
MVTIFSDNNLLPLPVGSFIILAYVDYADSPHAWQCNGDQRQLAGKINALYLRRNRFVEKQK